LQRFLDEGSAVISMQGFETTPHINTAFQAIKKPLTDAARISRFSRLEFSHMLRVSDSAVPGPRLANSDATDVAFVPPCDLGARNR